MSSKAKTIFALATPFGRSGVAIIRVSGDGAFASLQRLTQISKPKPRHAYFKKLVNPDNQDLIDEAVVICYAGPASYTGENTVEYQIHGSLAVINGLIEFLSNQSDHRMAEPGEFTRRAFENGKLDLTQAEAVADLIDAQTTLQKSQALNQMGGGLAKIYEEWRDTLTKILAHLEADIEFPDEDDPEQAGSAALRQVQNLINDIENHLSDNNRGERLRDGLRVVIFGAPNAGKSSLTNVLAKRDVAIVSDIAGTTRDLIEVNLDLSGIPVILTDTAGLRSDHKVEGDQDKIEAEGVKRALQLAVDADIKILLFDGAIKSPDPHTLSLLDNSSIIAISKSDQDIKTDYPAPAIHMSSKTGNGIDDLLAALTDKAQDLIGTSEAPSITRQRHRQALQDCLESLFRIQNAHKAGLPELIAEDLRLATRHLGRITGRVDVEDLLDVIFNDFCIGK